MPRFERSGPIPRPASPQPFHAAHGAHPGASCKWLRKEPEKVIRVDILQEEGTFLGTVVRCDAKIPGFAAGEGVVENLDFVFVVARVDKAADATRR
jgi:hypothetical protein